MKILYDHQIFCTQQYGGVSRYHIELTKELKKYSNFSIDIPALCYKNSYLAEYKNSNLYILKNKEIHTTLLSSYVPLPDDTQSESLPHQTAA